MTCAFLRRFGLLLNRTPSQRMAGLTNLLLSTQPGAASVDADSYLEQAASASPPENTQLDDLRAIALYYELYQMTGQWRKASAGLARSASDVRFMVRIGPSFSEGRYFRLTRRVSHYRSRSCRPRSC